MHTSFTQVVGKLNKRAVGAIDQAELESRGVSPPATGRGRSRGGRR